MKFWDKEIFVLITFFYSGVCRKVYPLKYQWVDLFRTLNDPWDKKKDALDLMNCILESLKKKHLNKSYLHSATMQILPMHLAGTSICVRGAIQD